VRVLAEVAPSKIEVIIGQGCRVAVDASLDAAAPEQTGSTTRFDAVALLLAISLALGAAFRLVALRIVLIELPHLLDRESPRQGQGDN
jgi:hypothetical protein